ncbi:Bug family tripartite tricarboxylate transporter substrate binding protein [Roseateles sp.]|uniref:Bug family tripartite tricarboxylate transporter substrate binding protein n=1 Tax=Roseateles sp. TaxID=1971397 RepID=UPI0039E938E3
MRHFLLCVAALATLASPVAATAQPANPDGFPTRPLRMLVPVPAGGPSDFIARQVAHQLGTSLGQVVTVENKPGANGLVAAREALAAPADGHTLLYAPGSMIAMPLLVKGSGMDWSQDFAPLGKIGRVPFALAVYSGVQARTVAELVKQAGQQPGTLNVATSTPSEVLAAAQFMKAAGIQLTRVPYKGGTQALPDLLAGRVQLMFGPLSLLQPQTKSGALRVLAVVTPERSPALPDVPTMSEVGFAEVEVPTWQGLYTVAKVPAALRARLAAALDAVMAKPDMRAEFERRLLAVERASPRELTATITRELAVWSAVVDEFKLNAD